MVMLFNLEFEAWYGCDYYLATAPHGESPRACVRMQSGGLLFYSHPIV